MLREWPSSAGPVLREDAAGRADGECVGLPHTRGHSAVISTGGVSLPGAGRALGPQRIPGAGGLVGDVRDPGPRGDRVGAGDGGSLRDLLDPAPGPPAAAQPHGGGVVHGPSGGVLHPVRVGGQSGSGQHAYGVNALRGPVSGQGVPAPDGDGDGYPGLHRGRDLDARRRDLRRGAHAQPHAHRDAKPVPHGLADRLVGAICFVVVALAGGSLLACVPLTIGLVFFGSWWGPVPIAVSIGLVGAVYAAAIGNRPRGRGSAHPRGGRARVAGVPVGGGRRPGVEAPWVS